MHDVCLCVCVCVSYSKNDVLLVFITALGSTTTTTLLLRGTAERRQKINHIMLYCLHSMRSMRLMLMLIKDRMKKTSKRVEMAVWE